MKKKIKNTLLSALFTGFATTVVAATALGLSSGVRSVAADTETSRFAMVNGAGIRYSEPLGMRFIAELGTAEYADLTTSEEGVTKKMGMFIMPYDFIDTNGDGELDVTEYASVETKLTYTFYASDGSEIDKELYEYVDEKGDTYYRANGVISNLKLQNYAREFVGIGWISETSNGSTTYEYTDISYNANVRTAAYIAIEAHADPDYANVDNALRAFTQYVDGAQLNTNYGVTYDETSGKYMYGGASYESLAAVKNAIPNYAYSLTLDKSVKYVKTDGASQLGMTLSDSTKEVAFKGAHAVYSSSNPEIVTVDKNGKLSWVKNGTATITATFMDTTQTCNVISGAIDFEDGKLPSYITEGGRASVSVVDGALNVKAQKSSSGTENNNNNARAKMELSYIGALFEDPDIDYMAFDLKMPADFTTSGSPKTIYYQNFAASGQEGTQVWTTYCDYNYSSYETAPIGYYKTYYMPRAVYQAWVDYDVTNCVEGVFINVGAGILEASEGYYIDNIRAVTAEEKAEAHNWYSFEYGGIRTNNGTTILLYDHEQTDQWQLGISNVDQTTAKYTSDLVSDGNTALQFTKVAGATTIQLNPTCVSVKETELRNAGYISYDLYVPEGSDAKMLEYDGTYPGTPLSKGWNTVYAQVDGTDDNISRFTDTTASTYVIDNIRFITADEYFEKTYSFEEGTSTLRNDNAADTAGVFYVYSGADQRTNRYSIAVTGIPVNPHFSSEVVHDGDGEYSLAFTKANGSVNLQFRADSEAYAKLKNGFTFWLYADLDEQPAINGTGTGNFNNGNNEKPNGGAGYFITARTWTKITLTVDDIVQGTGDAGCTFLRIGGSSAGTYYIDGLKPLETYTVTYDAGDLGSVESATQAVYYGESYTLATPTTEHQFLGWYDENGELVPTTGTWSIKGNVTLTARYIEGYYNTTVGTDGSITLNAGSYGEEGASESLPDAGDANTDQAFYRMGGEYGLDDFLVFDMTGNNMPIVSFFTSEVTNSIYNTMDDTATEQKGYIFFNGIFNELGLPDGGYAGNLSNRLNLIGPYKITYRADNSKNETPLSGRTSDGSSPSNPNPVSLASLNGSTDEYRVILGWVENSSNTSNMVLRVVVWNLTKGVIVYDGGVFNVSKADWTGDIVLYGHFGKATKIDTLYPIEEDTTIEQVKTKYMPSIVVYNGTWDENGGLTLSQSTSEGGDVNSPTSADMSYIAFNGSYGLNDYVVFDMTGKNMPIVSFFNNEVTNTVFNNSVIGDNAVAADENARGWVWFNGLYRNNGDVYGGAGGTHSCRMTLIGYHKVIGYDNNTNDFRLNWGSTSDINPISITGLTGVTDTYRVIIGIGARDSSSVSLEVGVINMVTGEVVYNTVLQVANTNYQEGSIALHGQFGKTTVLDKVIGVEEDTTLAALISKYGKDTDYSDETAVTLDRYAYSSLSDGQWTLDGTDQVTNPTDYRTLESTYITYEEAGFNILLAQDMINTDGTKATWEASANKTYMDNAYNAGLKVILTDWHLQIISAPIKVTSSGATASDSTYVPWIIGTDASATTGAAAEYLGYLSSLGITVDSTRFKTRNDLDKFVYEQLAPYKDHPAFYGVMLADEPSYHNAYCYGEVYKSIKRVMADCYVQYNLLPLEHSFGTIQYRYPGLDNYTSDTVTNPILEEAYKSYVTSFLDTMGTDYIQYDDYPFKSTEQWSWSDFSNVEDPYVDPTSLRNIQIIAKIAKERGLDVKVVTQSSVMKSGGASGAVHIRQVTENDARWLNNYLMGFGVKQINYFTYWTKRASTSDGEYFVDGGSFVNRDGTPTNLYTFMQTIMADNDKFAPTISHFDYNASQIFGSDNNSDLNNEHISWSSSLTAAASFKWLTSVTTSLEYTLVTELYDSDNYNYMYMVMNTIDPNDGGTQSVTVTLDSSITSFYVYDQSGNRTLVTGNSYTVSLTAGQAVYILPCAW